jgi:hypothetical protein
MSLELRLGFSPEPLWVFGLQISQLLFQSLECTLAIEYASLDLIFSLAIEARVMERVFEQDQCAGNLCDRLEGAADAGVKALVGMVVFVEPFASCEAERDDANSRRGDFCHCEMCCEVWKTGEGAVKVYVHVRLTRLGGNATRAALERAEPSTNVASMYCEHVRRQNVQLLSCICILKDSICINEFGEVKA